MRILVGMGSCGIAAGAKTIFEELKKAFPLQVEVTGCNGKCYLEPIVTVISGENFYDFTKVDKNNLQGLIDDMKKQNYPALENKEKYPKIALRNLGLINPEKIEDYIERGGYRGLPKIDIIDEIKKSGLQGRGGAGFPTYIKWQALKDESSLEKYIITNADEGDPGAFMDRAILEGDPHSVIEGMLIAGFATKAKNGIIYVRAEYPLAIKRLEVAIKQAEEKGFIGESCYGSGFSFSVKIKKGAGAFVCGEETALIASLEGERGMPRLKPPFPFQKGYFGKPSNINNVETLANIPYIIYNGALAFSKIGTEKSKGTKVFALAGKIKNGGLVEVPMGETLHAVIYNLGGGIINNGEFKAVQLGGPSGGCLPKELLDTKIDYSELAKTGAIMGSGGMVVMDNSACMVEMAKFFLNFTVLESCGKCTSCRVGTKRMLELLEKITLGEGKEGDIEKLEDMADNIKNGSLCGLGQTAPNPVLTAIRYFKEEFISHIKNKKCKAKACKNLLTYSIMDNCVGCTLCVKKCPVQAILGEAKKKHKISQKKCIKCGECKLVCKFSAVKEE